MIKANELRIGNLITYKSRAKTNEEMEVEPGSLFRIEDDENGYDPIPLTEEWLVKFGFKKHTNNSTWFISEEETLEEGDMCFCIENEDSEYNSGGKDGASSVWYFNQLGMISDVPIQYVHQLQNLYFALTGEELKYKQL